ncbi:hypothetical protein Zm00014a_029047 [Zea mays]|jgi:hypothetical protein|uniref:Uncharacterized protein n=2 Tax=Zea mays TaxID=4577 RepID=A0A3L6FJC7_MAIZE|nr:uncharacterized protein LOC100278687 [Zea mays]ACG46973.1 hypothetical protein [Zea mays]PWZ33209.1 hypothetical protein Zm00014a_029047 [Zea mays]|eukprot:NP_001145355.1 uncharacterized protein LOC100278687 [Zea mays]
MAAQEAVPIDAIGSQLEISLVGLEHAVLLTNNLDLAGQTFVVEKVQVRQAPALLEVIQRAVCHPKRKWVVRIPNTLKLRHIARISNEIEVVVAVVIPQLLRDNVDPTGARLLRRYAWSICHAARKVDGAPRIPGVSVSVRGPLWSLAADAAKPLLRYSAYVFSANRSKAWYEANVTKLAPAITVLLDYVVNIPYSFTVDAADDDDDSDNDDGGDDDDEHME